MRPSWDSFFLDLAVLWSTMSTCSRRQVGAVVVQDREHNAILQAGLERCLGATIYVTDQPCQQCANLIEHAKIARVVVMGHSRNDDGDSDGSSGTTEPDNPDHSDDSWDDDDE